LQIRVLRIMGDARDVDMRATTTSDQAPATKMEVEPQTNSLPAAALITTMNQIQMPAAPVPRDAANAPVRKLTVDLIRTYRHINYVYYLKKRKAAEKANDQSRKSAKVFNDGYDDERADLIIHPDSGEVWDGRYEVKKILGKGSFGQVVQAHDRITNEQVSIKIIKNKRAFLEQANVEVKLLEMLNSIDKDDVYNVGM